ncbi:UDP-N-acetylmuramoyl-L-alanyl-D-glutamate--2,6-diaminopimelate ligase [Trichococcus pasteurii]|uniref:UDP-N-acetylmuramyl-tripeptide synthetase n=1 Tax=Trichococcus pasteurii TaxID=43064 RepID=A0A1W1IH58_9LACT|nr:UDP-N-acetylmuramoyl-L-alanyl-D-glutamate--2,6-diaminopimelate ligase [Trichococcus pasteurii]SFE54275.1 UDP-N-acetylmuramoylalanyl-D-glutamate--2,6-diaminopimelate ligase [Trichococcus pasteurii]SLM52367.1 folylpolyglutamate synthase signature 1 [Trichococcus pasteurii]SSB93248.1 folylpolyglutamate synthase signature 1 [Trichococcus pasteurii]
MKLKQMLSDYQLGEQPKWDGEQIITGISDSSRDIADGMIFVAIAGFEQDGHDYIPHAIEQGAALIVGERDCPEALPIPYLKVANSRQALGQLADKFYQHPSGRKHVIGITGTNGKTTTAFFLKHLLEQQGFSVSLIGTIYNEINGIQYPTPNTTPNAEKVHELIAASQDDFVVIEVSSHGLTQYRLEGVAFDYALFMNLQHDHLDYHKTMEAYFEAKAMLFDKLKPNGKAVVNTDDIWGLKLAQRLVAKGIAVITVGHQDDAVLSIKKMTNQVVTLAVSGETSALDPHMPGEHNLYDIAMAGAVIQDLSYPLADVTEQMRSFAGVPGRYEFVHLKDGVHCIIDYAHTPEAVSSILTSMRRDGAERITHIFGFRGDRDASKRDEMIAASTGQSSRVILTTDDLNGIPEEMMKQEYAAYQHKFAGMHKVDVMMDRTLAIQAAVNEAREGDWILVTGKGHEKYKTAYALPTSSDKETVLFLKSSEK